MTEPATAASPRLCCGKHLAESRPCPGTTDGRHFPCVLYTRPVRSLFFRRVFWVQCWQCDLRLGPWPDRGFARIVEANLV